MFILSMLIPEVWSDSIHFADVPLGTFVFALLFFALLVQLLMKPGAVTSPIVFLTFGALVFMAVLGFVRGNIENYSFKFYVADIFCFSSLIAGAIIARTQNEAVVARLVSRSALIICGVIVLTYIGLFAGVVTTSFEIEGRTVTGSIFNAIGLLVILLPWATAPAGRAESHGGWRTLAIFGVAIATGLISATRSVIIEVTIAAVCYLILQRNRFGFSFLLRLTGGVAALTLMLYSSLPVLGTFVFQRLSNTNFGDESRFEELSMFWPQVLGDAALGQGMGSRFVSNVIFEGNPLALAPHIGIFTFFMKGGVVMFAAYAIIPAAIAVRILFSGNRQEYQRAAAASTLMFTLLACLSGGWSPLALLAYGLAIGAMTQPGKRSRSLEQEAEGVVYLESGYAPLSRPIEQ